MLILIPTLFFLLCFVTFALQGNHPQLRRAFLLSSVTTGTLILLITELLSLFKQLTLPFILLLWTLATILAAFSLAKIQKKKRIRLPSFLKDTLQKRIHRFQNLSFSYKCFLVWTLFILLIVGLTAFIAPPNNWDSMTYHMSRVSHWIQNQSVNIYPTNIPRQINYPPWAEYAICNMQLLLGSDRMANLVQWASMIGSIIAASLLAQIFKANKETQILAALVTATIPMGILQGSSTQNDYVTSFWLIAFIYFFYSFKNEHRNNNTLFAGLSLGLCFLTKGTGYFYAIPFLGFLSIPVFLKKDKNRIKKIGIILLLAFLMNAKYYARNMQFSHSVLPPSESGMLNQSKSPQFYISNLIQNIATHFGTPFNGWNQMVKKSVYTLNSSIGLDPQTAKAQGLEPFYFAGLPFHEDHAGNFLHLLFILGSLLIVTVYRGKRKNTSLVLYALILIIISILSNLIIRWNLFQSRYHLPLFVLWSPFIAGMFTFNKQKRTLVLPIILCFSCLPWLFYNQSRPLLKKQNIFNTKRADQYFANRPYLNEPYTKTTDYIKKNKALKLGLSCGLDDWEYPFWVQLNINQSPIRLEHVKINPIGPKSPKQKSFIPEIIIDLNNNTNNKIQFQGVTYIRTRKFYPINIFVKETSALRRDNLKDHFKKMFTLNFMARSLPFTNENFPNILLLRKEEYNEASLIDTEELKKMDALLANHFTNELLPGLTYRIMGYASKDSHKKALGEAFISKWNMWINQNKTTIKLLLVN